MINELVNSILQAEAKADEIQREAAERASSISAEADRRDSAVRQEAEQQLKEESKAILDKNEREADELYGKILENGRAEAEIIKADGKNKAEELSEEVVRWIISGNC